MLTAQSRSTAGCLQRRKAETRCDLQREWTIAGVKCQHRLEFTISSRPMTSYIPRACFTVLAGFLIVCISQADAESLTIYGPDGAHTLVTRDRPQRGTNISGHLFDASEMAEKCLSFKAQAASDSRLTESVDSDIYSVSFPFSDGSCNFQYEGGIRIPWSCEDDDYPKCLRMVLEAGIEHRLRSVGVGDSTQLGAPVGSPFKLYFDFVSDPSVKSPCSLLIDGMGNPSYEPGYIFLAMSVKLSINCLNQ